MGSSRTRAWTCVPCIGRWILNHCATREVLKFFFSSASGCPIGPASLLKRLFFLHWITFAPLSKISLPYLRRAYFWILCVCPSATTTLSWSLPPHSIAAFSTGITYLPSAQETSYLWELQILSPTAFEEKRSPSAGHWLLLRSFKGQLTFLNFDSQVSLLLSWQHDQGDGKEMQ